MNAPSYRDGFLYFSPAMKYSGSQVTETDQDFSVSLDMPGVKADDIQVTLEDGILSMKGVRKVFDSKGNVAKKYRLSRSFSVDNEAILASSLKANVSDGVLTVTAIKKKKPEPLQIRVTTKDLQEDGPNNEPADNKETPAETKQ